MGSAQSSLDDKSEIKRSTEIKFHLQNQEHVVNTEDIDPSTSLNFYLRNILHLTGTKGMCFEGGCGACLVVLQKKDSATQKDIFISVNSCLVPLLSCNGWRILTIEGIGNPIDGYHPVQEVLANFNGTQCGFCSPGMVMNMYALYESGKLTMEEVENSFSGNICRCTGYRPIMTAFKTLCKDASRGVLGEYPDIEDLVACHDKKRGKCEDCPKFLTEKFFLEFEESRWVKVYALRDLLRTLSLNPTQSYRLVAGNTAQGVYPSYKDRVDLYIDITDVSELKVLESGDECVVGASTTLAKTIEFFKQTSKKPGFAYLEAMAYHISLIANVPVRNIATLAGNLMIKHDHHDFPSDIFLILETIAARLTIVDLFGQETDLSPLDFINRDLNHMVLKTITLPPYGDGVKFISYKIMPRAQNVHALVNSGFLYKFDQNNTLQSATIVYGNINPKFVHGTKSEKLLQGKNLFDNDTLHQVCQSLGKELEPEVSPPDPSPKFRKQLAIALFYKGVLSIAPSDKISPRHKSGADLLKRPISKGTQDYETNKSLYPLTKAIPKLEALAQTSGQAQYVVDFPDLPYQLFAVFVQAKVPPNSKIKNIDATEALKHKDVVAFYTKDDIPGDNSFSPLMRGNNSKEEVFCSGTIRYYGQPIGLLVGKSEKSLEEATNLVEVSYDLPDQEPVLTVRQILEKGLTNRIKEFKVIKAKSKGSDVKHVIKGTCDLYQQYHFHMETQVCCVVPTENGLDVYSSTQWISFVQVAIARMLGVEESTIRVEVRRCGGAFGGKISRAGLTACGAALASFLLKKPVKMWMSLTANMTSLGKRCPSANDYEVGVDDEGIIQYLDLTTYNDVGYLFNEDITGYTVDILTSTYKSDTFTIRFKRAFTDTAVNTWARGPGSLEGSATLEGILDHISYVTNQDPLSVRLANLAPQSPNIKYLNDLKSWVNLDQRKKDIATFNKENRWKKKGLSVIPMNFQIDMIGPYFVLVSICHGDGSVYVCHGGIEIGQGINTKAAQVCAYKLGIPLEKVTVVPTNSVATTNSMTTGASVTSEAIAYGIIQACEELLGRMKPYKSVGMTWDKWVEACYDKYVTLMAIGACSPTSPGIKKYTVYGVCATEVLVDILTGQHLVTSVNIIEDVGVSMSPFIDIGQIEGAFIMGMGYHTTEKIVYSYDGKVLTNNTWTYHPPLASDIPIDFNVKFVKNNPNPLGVLRSKATGEPAICLSFSVALAIRNALASARTDAAASNPKWYKIDGTTDVENVFLNSLNDCSQYVL